jgi:hypothetical protein
MVLVAAGLVAQNCGSRETEVSKEDAVVIAKREIDYEPERVLTRFVPRGFQSRPSWAVSLSTLDSRGDVERVTVVVVDGVTGDVVEIRRQGG